MIDMGKTTTWMAAACLAAGSLGLIWGPLSTAFHHNGEATETVDRPREELVSLAAPIATATKEATAADRVRLVAFYSAMADVLQRDQGKVIQTTGQFRETYRRAGLLMFQKTGLGTKFPNLADAIDKLLVARIGLDDVALDPAKQATAIEALRAIAWAAAEDRNP